MSEPASHPFYKPQNIRRLKIVALVLLLLSVLAEGFIHLHGHFGFDEIFGFTAASGFLGSLLLIVLALVIAVLLRRPENYYDAG